MAAAATGAAAAPARHLFKAPLLNELIRISRALVAVHGVDCAGCVPCNVARGMRAGRVNRCACRHQVCMIHVIMHSSLGKPPS